MRDNTYEEIKARLTMPQVAGHYGYETNRSGFLRCPFHSGDHTASLKLYLGQQGWYCFGCGKGGGPVEFVRELFNLSKKEAVAKLNMDFSLGLPIGRQMSYMERQKLEEQARQKRAEIEREREEWKREESKELLLTLQYRIGWMALRDVPEEEWTPLECECIRDLATIEYKLDALIDKRWADGNRRLTLSHNKYNTDNTNTHNNTIQCEPKEDPEITQLFLKECAKKYGRAEECDPDRGSEMELHERRLPNWKETLRRTVRTEE